MPSLETATAVDGFDQLLPGGERVLWVGAPDPWRWLKRSLALRAVWLWLGGIALFGVATGSAGVPVFVWLGVVGAIGTAFVVVGIVWTSRATRYLITDRRVALRIGLALPGEVNLPLGAIENAAVRRFGDGSGDIAITPSAPLGVGYAVLWPHARPWRLSRPEPLLRSIEGVDDVAAVLRAAVEASGARTELETTRVA